MKIIDHTDTTVEFSAIRVGECFLCDKCLFIRICPIDKSGKVYANAFCFVDNSVCFLRNDYNVIPVDADIVVRSKGVKNDA